MFRNAPITDLLPNLHLLCYHWHPNLQKAESKWRLQSGSRVPWFMSNQKIQWKHFLWDLCMSVGMWSRYCTVKISRSICSCYLRLCTLFYCSNIPQEETTFVFPNMNPNFFLKAEQEHELCIYWIQNNWKETATCEFAFSHSRARFFSLALTSKRYVILVLVYGL